MRAIDVLLILLTVMIWGTNFVAIRWGLDEMPPLFFTGLRFLLVAFPAILFIPKPKASWSQIFWLGLFIGTLQFSLLFFAMAAGLPAGVASLIMQVQVVFTLMMSAWLFRERISWLQGAGIFLAFIGFAVLVRSDDPDMPGFIPILIALLGAFSWACGNLVYKTTQGSNRFHLTIYSALVAPVPMFVLSYLYESAQPLEILTVLSWRAWGSVFFTVVLSTIVAYGIWGTLLGKYPSILVTPWALTIPLFGFSSAAILLGEEVTPDDVIASVLILLGLGLCLLAPEIGKRWTANA